MDRWFELIKALVVIAGVLWLMDVYDQHWRRKKASKRR